MIWVGTCRWDLKSGPIFIPNFAEKWDPFLYQSHKFRQNLLRVSHYFPKLLSFQANFGNFGIRLMELGLFFPYFRANFGRFWKYDPCLYQLLHWIRGHRYTRRLILQPISAARPRIDLCTKNPPPGGQNFWERGYPGGVVERWVRGCAAQIGCFFDLSGFPMAPFLFENWFRYRSHFCKMHNFWWIFPSVYL